MKFFKLLWSSLFIFCTKRKLVWFLSVIYHIPSLIMLPTTDAICSAENRTALSDEQLREILIQDGYKISLQLLTYFIFGCNLYTLVCAYNKEKADERLIQNLTKINQPNIKSLEILRIVRFETPFNFVIFSHERILLLLEFFYALLLMLRFSYIATCGLLYENGEPQWTVSIFENIMVKERDVMPNAVFAYANFYLLTGLYFVIFSTAVTEIVAVVILFGTPKLRSCILASLCVGVEGKLAALFVAHELNGRQVWRLCAVGYLSPKHFTHAIAVIRKEICSLQQYA